MVISPAIRNEQTFQLAPESYRLLCESLFDCIARDADCSPSFNRIVFFTMSNSPSLGPSDKAIALFERKAFDAARVLFEESLKTISKNIDRQDCLFNIAACLASEGQYKEALHSLADIDDTSNDLLYNKGLCNYKLGNYNDSLQLLEQLLANCHESYPELSIKTDDVGRLPRSDYDDPESIKKLKESRLIEALNLKAAVLFKLNGDLLEPKRCLDEGPIKSLDQLDCVTLHNQAIYGHVIDIESSIEKLTHLSELAKGSQDDGGCAGLLVPKEIYLNLIILITIAGQRDAAIKFIHSNKSQIEQNVSADVIQFIEILLEFRLTISNDSLVYRNLDKLLFRVIEKMKKIESSKNNFIQDLTNSKKFALTVLTHQGSILWHNNQYQALERLLVKVEPYFKNDNLWKKNLAHTLYMLDTRFDDCAQLYEELLPKSNTESLLSVEPLVLGNLCVAYVLTGRNGEAEALIKDVESDEARFTETHALDSFQLTSSRSRNLMRDEESRHQRTIQAPTHLIVINLVIGTLYCVKYNYEFGLIRLIKTLEPIEQKLNTQTWFHVKRCILAMLDSHCKQMICIKDDLFDQLASFLIQCERHGIQIETMDSTNAVAGLTEQDFRLFNGRNSVTFEARQLRAIALTITHD